MLTYVLGRFVVAVACLLVFEGFCLGFSSSRDHNQDFCF
jgi:hypothetical protein